MHTLMMPTQLERVTLLLREMILAGEFEPGRRIAEIPLAERLGVSRTPVRLALGALEREGLVVSAPRRGFAVRAFTVRDVIDAFDVRGALEGLACRLVAERGLARRPREELAECLAEAERMLAKGHLVEADFPRWSAMNSRFHRVIVGAADNAPLAQALELNDRMPLAAAGAIAFLRNIADLVYKYMSQAHAEHERVFDALCKGSGTRAEHLMREHAYTSRENIARCLADLKNNGGLPDIRGLRLIVGGRAN